MTDQKTIHELIESVDAKMRELEYSEKTLYRMKQSGSHLGHLPKEKTSDSIQLK